MRKTLYISVELLIKINGVDECARDLTAFSIFKFVNLDLKSFASRR